MSVYVPTTADVLRGIAEEIERDPSIWTQGEFWRGANDEDCYPADAVCACSIGLIRLACDDWDFDAADALRRAIGARSVVGWNDAPGRTHVEVADAFRRAADLIDEGTA